MSIQHYLELETDMSIAEIEKLMEYAQTHLEAESDDWVPNMAFDIELNHWSDRAIALGIQTNVVITFWNRAYDIGFAKAIYILLNTTMNLAHYYQDMDDPMFYRVDGKVSVNAEFGWGAERLEIFKNIPHELVNFKEPK